MVRYWILPEKRTSQHHMRIPDNTQRDELYILNFFFTLCINYLQQWFSVMIWNQHLIGMFHYLGYVMLVHISVMFHSIYVKLVAQQGGNFMFVVRYVTLKIYIYYLT